LILNITAGIASSLGIIVVYRHGLHDISIDDTSDEKDITLAQYAGDCISDLKQYLNNFKSIGLTTNKMFLLDYLPTNPSLPMWIQNIDDG
jgi:hypothetical protein